MEPPIKDCHIEFLKEDNLPSLETPLHSVQNNLPTKNKVVGPKRVLYLPLEVPLYNYTLCKK